MSVSELHCLTVKTVENYIHSIAPFDTAEAFDNVGLLVGKHSNPVSRILVTLDVTMAAVKEAIDLGAELIVTHHPLLFRGRKNLVEEDPEAMILCELIRNRINVIAAHTNLDASFHSASACIARALKLQNLRQEGFLFIGELPSIAYPETLKNEIEGILGSTVRIYGSNAPICALAIAGGAYDEGYVQARQSGAQALLTGEVKHHNALAAAMEGFVLFDGTHWGTEQILVPHLAASLQKALSELKYSVNVYPSSAALFGSCID